MTTRHYDAVVIGGRLSASITAALLGKRGLRGLLIDQGELASIDGKLLPDLVVAEQGSLAMELVHSELGVREDLKVRSQIVSPTIQAIFPDERIDLYAASDAFLEELRRAFGREADAFGTLLERVRDAEARAGDYLATVGELPATGFFGRRAASTIVRRFPELGQDVDASGLLSGLSAELKEVVLAPLPFVTHMDTRRPGDVTVARFARAIGRFMKGIARLDDGRSLRELFLDVARRKGFEVRRSAVESLEPGKTAQIRIAGSRDDLVTADVLVDCSQDLSGLDAIPHRHKSKDLAHMLQSARPRGFLHALSIVVDAAVIPPGMAEHLILLNGRKDPSRFDSRDPDAEDRPVLLTHRGPTPIPGRVQLIAVHPVSSVRAHLSETERLDEVIRARVERLIPFLGEGHPVLEPLSSRSASREARPFLAHPLFDPELDRQLGIAGIPMRTKFKNVFIAGPAVMPGLGIEGEYFSALQAADACEALQGGAKRPKTLAERAGSLPEKVGVRSARSP